jgi:hypothetical protein
MTVVSLLCSLSFCDDELCAYVSKQAFVLADQMRCSFCVPAVLAEIRTWESSDFSTGQSLGLSA